MNVSPTQPRSLTQGRHVRVLGVPMDIGGAGPGASGGPQALREAGLSRMLGPADIDLGDIEVEPLDASLEIVRGSDPESRRPEWPLIRTACSTLRDKVEAIVTEGHLPLVAGGDHGLAAGSMAGVARAFREAGRPVPGLIWFDAHGDLNTPETSPSGNPHGMPAAALLGYGVPPFDDVIGPDGFFDRTRSAFVGCRDLDHGESLRFNESGPHLFGDDRFQTEQPEDIADQILDRVAPDGGAFALSFDLDVIDPKRAPGVNLAVPGGLRIEQVMRVLERLAAHGGCVAMDVVELDPSADIDGKTARIGVEAARAMLRTT